MNNLPEIIRHTHSRQFENGIVEMTMGATLLVCGGALSFGQNPLMAGGIALVGIVLVGRYFDQLQLSVAYPRGGFAQYPEQAGRGLLINMIVGLVVSLCILGIFLWLLISENDSAIAWLVSLLGLVIGISLFAQGLQLRLARLVIYGCVALGLASFFSPMFLAPELTTGYAGVGLLGFFFLALGAVMTGLGWLAFRAFIKNNPPLQDAGKEDGDGQ